jgi:hypothetical protein
VTKVITWGAVFWVIVAVVAWANCGHLTEPVEARGWRDMETVRPGLTTRPGDPLDPRNSHHAFKDRASEQAC